MSISVCFVTAPSREVALALAKQVVGSGLAACVNCLPEVDSVYRWQEDINIDSEVLMIIKTEERLVKRLKEAILSEHPYDVPEFVSIRSADVSEKYAAWIRSVTESSNS